MQRCSSFCVYAMLDLFTTTAKIICVKKTHTEILRFPKICACWKWKETRSSIYSSRMEHKQVWQQPPRDCGYVTDKWTNKFKTEEGILYGRWGISCTSPTTKCNFTYQQTMTYKCIYMKQIKKTNEQCINNTHLVTPFLPRRRRFLPHAVQNLPVLAYANVFVGNGDVMKVRVLLVGKEQVWNPNSLNTHWRKDEMELVAHPKRGPV